jgi:Fe-S cluster biogenesis protein NfuA/nitrite reductase/ring-hydroxylating ferredoxin subunit
MLVDDRELTERAGRIEALLDDLESFPDSAMREKATELVRDLLVLYGEGLARMLTLIEQAGEPPISARIIEALAGDELISHLLFLHDLHPIDLETRVTQALDEVRPYLQSHGGNVELIGIEDGVARLRLQGSCSGCPSSTVTLKLAIEEALLRAAPDLEGIEADGVAEPPPQPVNFLPVTDLIPLTPREAPSGPRWIPAEGIAALADGELRVVDLTGTPVLFLRSAAVHYAYRDRCPACRTSLAGATLRDADLLCPGCGHRFDVRRAGRCLDSADHHLEPVPLLVRSGEINVALGTPSGAR